MATKRDLLQENARLRAALSAMEPRKTANCPWKMEAAIREAFPDLSSWEQERFIVVLLDARLRVLSVEVVALGTVSQVETHPRDVFRAAVRGNAFSIVIAHNHPSGDESPSASDHDLTTRMVEAGKILGIPVVDHLVLSAGGSFSFAGNGLLK